MTFNLHLIDGTFELFRAYYSSPKMRVNGKEVGATRGYLRTLLNTLQDPKITHVGVAFDYVIESFRNDLFNGYKTGLGIEPDLKSQFRLVEQATEALGVVGWPMVEFEADDAIATAVHTFKNHPEISQIIICSPDKDFAQCVEGNKVIMWDRIRNKTYDEKGVVEKWGVKPSSIPDWLALVGDKADGIPGVPKWGNKSASTILYSYGRIEDIPDDETQWKVKVRGAKGLAENLRAFRTQLSLYKILAKLRLDVPLEDDIDSLQWNGAEKNKLSSFCKDIGYEKMLDRVKVWID